MTATVIRFPAPAAKPQARAKFIEQLLAPLPAHEVRADSAAYRQTVAVMMNIERFSSIVSARPNYTPQKPSEAVLNSPGGSHGCAKCYMQCAIAADRLAWWEDELAKASDTRAIGRA